MEVREPIALYGRKRWTIEQYLEFERASETKHEYYKGEVFDMAGAGVIHNIIFKNVYIGLGKRLEGNICQPYGSDLRIHIPENDLFTYPDITLICGDFEPADKDPDTVTNPAVLIEILSHSTKNFDRNEKFELYKQIPTLREYITIDSESIYVEIFRKKPGGNWYSEDYKTLNEEIQIPTLRVFMSLDEIYKGAML